MNTRTQTIKLLQDLTSGIKTISSLLPMKIPVVIYTLDGMNYNTTSGEPISNEQLAKNKNPIILCYNGGTKFANAESEIDGTPWDASKQYYAIQQS